MTKDRNEIAREDLKAKVSKEVINCEQCGKKCESVYDKKIDGKNHKFCSRECISVFDKQMSAARIRSIKERDLTIRQIERDIEFKNNQISFEIVETRTIQITPGQSPVIVDGYIDNKKPKHILQNEVDGLKRQVELIKADIKNMEDLNGN